MTRVRTAVVMLAGVAILATPTSAQNEPAPGALLQSAASYLSTFAPRVAGVTLEETYTMLEVAATWVLSTRRIVSDVVLADVDGKVAAVRDPFLLNGNPLRERTPRIAALLARPTPAAWTQVRAYASESIRYFHTDLVVLLNQPTLALQFVAPDNQARVAYALDGRRRINGIEVWALRFEELKSPEADYILKTPGKAAASGRLWIDPATGRIHRTELAMKSATEFARIDVDYARDAPLDLWLPSSMIDTYETSEVVSTGRSMERGTSRRFLECRATYSNPRRPSLS